MAHGRLVTCCATMVLVSGLVSAWAAEPPGDGPEQQAVAVTLYINKIYAVDEVDETFAVDAYLNATWSDPRLAAGAAGELQRQCGVFAGDAVDQKLGGEVWWPVLELINGVGARQVGNRLLEIAEDGSVTYSERFTATLAAEMDFRPFPFDQQVFPIRIESFTEDLESLRFVRPQVFPDRDHLDEALLVEWHVLDQKLEVTTATYEGLHLRSGTGGPKVFSRIDLEISARRRPGYFVWQVFVPLFLIIITSWIVFWVDDFASQLASACTFMLTVVAFNFFVSTKLPHLPYNTFIEAVVTSGYISIFLTVIAILVHDLALRRGDAGRARAIGRTCRWFFPMGYAVVLGVLFISFF